MPEHDPSAAAAWRGLCRALALLAALQAALVQGQETRVYRCGNAYSATPCPGGTAVNASDERSPAQQREALEVAQREAALAERLRAERRAAERAAMAQKAIRIGPEAAATPMAAASKPKKPTGKKKTHKPAAGSPPQAKPAPPARLGAYR